MGGLIWVALCVALLMATPAAAIPLGTLISGWVAGLGVSVGATAVISTLGRVVLTLAVAAWQRNRLKKKMSDSGIETQFIGSGGTTPMTICLGTTATAGHLEAPQMTHPETSDPPNLYLTYVIGLGDVAGIVPTGRVVIDDSWHDLAGETPGMEIYGQTVAGDLADTCWFRFKSGEEITADPFLLANFGAASERPWLADMIGRGVPHVIATFKRDAELYPGEPRLRFEVKGIPLYDPRLDTTVGGAGLQRWSDRGTWTFTDNPKVIEYNILRGITIDGFGVWGGVARAEDLPLAVWFAAMNECDLLVDDGSGGTVRQYRFGLEVPLDETPAKIIDEINRSCGGETVEIGGIYKTRVGGVGLPILAITDDDLIVTQPQEADPFPGLDDTFNAVSASFPDPSLLWEAREAPPLTNGAWEMEDAALEFDAGAGGYVRRPRRLLKQMSLPGVSDLWQVQRLMSAYAREARKRRGHVITLPPIALMLEPLDAISWTSARNGYAGKIFDVVMTADPVISLLPRIGLLEADHADYTPPLFQPLPTPSPKRPAAGELGVPGFAVTAIDLTDAAGKARRPALQLAWTPGFDARGIAFEIRLAATGSVAAQGTIADISVGTYIVTGLLPGASYSVRARALSDRPAIWTTPIVASTTITRLVREDLDSHLHLRELGSAAWVAIPGTVVIGPTVSGYSVVRSSVVAEADVPDKWIASCGVRLTLSAVAARPIAWRLVWVPAGGSVVTVLAERVDMLLPGVALRVTASAPADIVVPAFSVRIEVSGQTLSSGESVTADQAMLQLLATDL